MNIRGGYVYAIGICAALFMWFPTIVDAAPTRTKMIDAWEITCKTDEMTDVRYCLARNKTLLVGLGNETTGSITIIGAKPLYPGEPIALRIDTKRVHTTRRPPWTMTDYILIVMELMDAKYARTRHWEWPDKIAIDTEIDPKGFPAVWDYMRHEVGHPSVTKK